MSILRGLFGFIIGTAVSVSLLVLLATIMPLVLGKNASEQASLAENETTAEITTKEVTVPVVKPEQPVSEVPAVEAVEKEQEVEAPKAEVIVVEPEQPVVEPETVAEQQPTVVEQPVTEEPPVAEEQPATIEQPVAEEQPVVDDQPVVEPVEPEAPEAIVQQEQPEVAPVVPPEVDQPEVAELPKTVTLPTIDTTKPVDDPAEPVEQTAPVEQPANDTGITVGKKPSSNLPTITQEAPEEIPEEVTQEDTQEASPDNALEFNATDFEGSERPLLGVILVDIGAEGLDIESLKKLNAPLTIAIRVSEQDASERALKYNEAGFEVIAMAAVDQAAALNKAGNATQVQNALDVIFNTVPHAIGLLDNAQGSIQKNNRISGDLVNSLNTTGHGLLTNAKGLNSIDRVANAAGVRSAKIARSLDANGEGKSQIVRYLDKASLDAGRDGSVIILGTTAKETVATVAVWLLSSKGQSVVLAPASAVLLQ